MPRRITRTLAGTTLAILCAFNAAPADEGMWLFTRPPIEALKEKYNFTPTEEWLTHVQRAAIRMNNGGSASFVSPNGLVMTNHHVGSDCIEKLSTAERNLLETGFLAKSNEDELKCEDLEVNVLWSIDDVTDAVKGAARPEMSPAEANTARREKELAIEKECEDSTKLDCQVVTLYHGGKYHLYRYKRFDDVRLVMAPEQAIAFFGGDADNFEFPRFNLDVTFFRVYENGKPINNEHYLKWSPSGSKEGELVFVAGHPGSTRRLNTVAELRFMRDLSLPLRLASIWRREVQLKVFAKESKEHYRQAIGDIHVVENGRKAITGRYQGLLDPDLMAQKAKDEQALREAVASNPEYQKQWGDAWDQLAAAQRKYSTFYLEHTTDVRSDLFSIARSLVRMSAELKKPSEKRLPEYADTGLDRLRLRLFSPAPIYEELEIERLSSSLSYLAERFGAEDPFVVLALDGKSPEERAAELVKGTKLKDVDFRKKLADGGAEAVEAAKDPMIQFAAALDPRARQLRKRFEDEIESVETEAHEKIAAARFTIYGENTYPDATFTLRLAYGTVQGYKEAGKEISPYTTLGGVYERYEARRGEEAFVLPESWIERKDKLNLATPFNFVSTNDIIGGNSGSPVFNQKGEVVGLIFDGNIQSLVLDFAYTDEQARAVSVDSRGMLEALRNIYQAERLVKELTGT